MSAQAGLQRLFLYHIWACVPFVIAWLIAPMSVGVSGNPIEIRSTYLVAAIALVYLLIRSWLTFRPNTTVRWVHVWPVADVLLISMALFARVEPQGSWLILLYLFPIMQAASTLSLRWAMGVGALSVGAYLSVCGLGGLEPLRHGYGIFRLFFLLLMASLVTALGREIVRAHKESALNDYRNELAAEMHDGIQQYLATIAMRLELARALIEKDPGEAARVAVDQRHLARQAADELRVMVQRLRLPQSEENGIANALRHYIGLVGNRSDLGVELAVTGDEARLDSRTEHAILRIAQEALTNVVKHANARSVRIGLEFAPGEVSCTIADDGAGFDITSMPERTAAECLGLENMRRRAAEVNGMLEISSTPGSGSTILLRIPRQVPQ